MIFNAKNGNLQRTLQYNQFQGTKVMQLHSDIESMAYMQVVSEDDSSSTGKLIIALQALQQSTQEWISSFLLSIKLKQIQNTEQVDYVDSKLSHLMDGQYIIGLNSMGRQQNVLASYQNILDKQYGTINLLQDDLLDYSSANFASYNSVLYNTLLSTFIQSDTIYIHRTVSIKEMQTYQHEFHFFKNDNSKEHICLTYANSDFLQNMIPLSTTYPDSSFAYVIFIDISTKNTYLATVSTTPKFTISKILPQLIGSPQYLVAKFHKDNPNYFYLGKNFNINDQFFTGLTNPPDYAINGAMGVIYSSKPDDSCFAVGQDTEQQLTTRMEYLALDFTEYTLTSTQQPSFTLTVFPNPPDQGIQALSSIADNWCKQLPYQFNSLGSNSDKPFQSHELTTIEFEQKRYLLNKVCDSTEYPAGSPVPELTYDIFDVASPNTMPWFLEKGETNVKTLYQINDLVGKAATIGIRSSLPNGQSAFNSLNIIGREVKSNKLRFENWLKDPIIAPLYGNFQLQTNITLNQGTANVTLKILYENKTRVHDSIISFVQMKKASEAISEDISMILEQNKNNITIATETYFVLSINGHPDWLNKEQRLIAQLKAGTLQSFDYHFTVLITPMTFDSIHQEVKYSDIQLKLGETYQLQEQICAALDNNCNCFLSYLHSANSWEPLDSLGFYDSSNSMLAPTLNSQASTYKFCSTCINTNSLKSVSQYFYLTVALVQETNEVSQEISTKLENSGPPIFDEQIVTSIQMTSGDQKNFKIPSVSDPDGDAYKINVELGNALMFARYSDGEIRLNPDDSHAQEAGSKPYQIVITLTDQGQNQSKSSIYKISIIVVSRDFEALNQDFTNKQKTPQKQNSTHLNNEIQKYYGTELQTFIKSIDSYGLLTLRFTEKIQTEVLSFNSTHLKIDFINRDSIDYLKSWNVTSLTDREVRIQLNFTEPQNVSTGEVRDQISVTFVNNETFKAQNTMLKIGYTTKASIPQQIVLTKAIQAMQGAAEKTTQSLLIAVITNAVLQIFLQQFSPSFSLDPFRCTQSGA
ncbi:hypothetical protein FGO68_gene7783 [Halteria grandinella]|uniref:Cadherin domain-containing protein n=1 Tax=Halteria grandinella TaxID=5974 RepID=A0A8J8P6K1_HALGN|nr:hypothetical protein FGO68_gene7783 [Halteria grandinella]